MLQHYLKLAIRVLWRRKVFTLISLFGISFTLVVLMLVAAMVDHLLAPMAPEVHMSRSLHLSFIWLEGDRRRSTGPPGYAFLDRYCRDLPGVESMTIFTDANQVASYEAGRKIVSRLRRTDGEYWRILAFEFVAGGPFTHEDERDARPVAVINEATQKRFFADTAAIGQTLKVDGQSFRVVGVVRNVPLYRRTACADIWVPISTSKTQEYRNELRDGFGALLYVPDASDETALLAEFASRLQHVEFPNDMYNKARGVPRTHLDEVCADLVWSEPENPPTRKVVALFLGAMALFMLLPTINLININVSRIFERSSEIGVRKAFGASSRVLVAQFVLENIVLCVVGGALGLLGAMGVIAWVNASGWIPYADFQINWRILLYAAAITLFFGCLSGAYPAWRMSRLHPVYALRGDTR
jgi:putative ABC transport system permease protein